MNDLVSFVLLLNKFRHRYLVTTTLAIHRDVNPLLQYYQVIASLPCYSAKNVNLQRGSGVFQRSIEGLKILNDHGYGLPDTGLELHLVYNPLGAFLPPDQVLILNS